MKRHAPLFLSIVAAFSLSACATTPKITIDQCPPGEVVTIHDIEYKQVPPPELPLADEPELTSDWTDTAAEADPDGWLEALLSDFKAVINAWIEDRQTIIDSNATRPPGG